LQICYRSCIGYTVFTPLMFGKGVTGIVIMLQSASRILRLEPASQLQATSRAAKV